MGKYRNNVNRYTDRQWDLQEEFKTGSQWDSDTGRGKNSQSLPGSQQAGQTGYNTPFTSRQCYYRNWAKKLEKNAKCKLRHENIAILRKFNIYKWHRNSLVSRCQSVTMFETREPDNFYCHGCLWIFSAVRWISVVSFGFVSKDASGGQWAVLKKQTSMHEAEDKNKW